MAAVGDMQDAAMKRKERLIAMRGGKSKGNSFENDGPSAKRKHGGEIALPKPIFRSYKPVDDSLKENQLPTIGPAEVKDHVTEQLEASKPLPLVDEVDLVNLAPRKPDWDLKRDVAKKLEKLERRTQRAIAALIRERLQTGKADLAEAVNATAEVEDDD